mmetsp:Transcript_38976/g.66504  ORF Transcript_38976/g.66504 Transcript_38976/m.66504 type:complete len:253 (-) Transcript_38976:485-1243(-)
MTDVPSHDHRSHRIIVRVHIILWIHHHGIRRITPASTASYHHHSIRHTAGGAHHSQSSHDRRCTSRNACRVLRRHTHPTRYTLGQHSIAHPAPIPIIQRSPYPLPLGDQPKFIPHDALAVGDLVLVDISRVLSRKSSEVHPLHAVNKGSIPNDISRIILLRGAFPGGETAHNAITGDIGLGGGARGITLRFVLVAMDPIAVVVNAVVVLHFALAVGAAIVVDLAGVEARVSVGVGVDHGGDRKGLFRRLPAL